MTFTRRKCKHDWVERIDGYEEQCTAAICRRCGAYGCRCNWLKSLNLPTGIRPTPEQESYFRTNGIPGNDHEIEKRLKAKKG
jgi:hypothetical protein